MASALKPFLFFVFLLLGLSGTLHAQQQGHPDPTFNPADAGFGLGGGANKLAYTAAVLPSGKTFIGGTFTTYNNVSSNRVAMLTTGGALDATFLTGTGVNGNVLVSAVQPDGKILIGGTFTLVDGVPRVRIARLNTNGSLDTSFDPGAGPDVQVGAILVLPGGKILIGGKFLNYDGQPTGYVARLNSNGTLDNSFSSGTGFSHAVSTFTLQTDGKILVGGDFISYNGTPYNRIIRLNPTGTIDTSFSIGTGASGGVRAIAVQTDGKIVIGGAFKKFNNITRSRIARLNADGSLDTGYNPNSSSTVASVVLQTGNLAVIGGDFVTVGGISRNRIARLNTDGTVDTTFDPGTGFNSSVYAIKAAPGNKIVAVGKFTLYNGVMQAFVSRLTSTGALDTTFNPGSGANNTVSSISLQPDGKIIVGGLFTGFNGLPRSRVVRLNTDGTPDLSFSPGVGPDNSVLATAVQPDGKIIIAGGFKKVNGLVRGRITRLNADGTPDATFITGTGANNLVQAVKLQADGKIILAGKFTAFNGIPAKYLVRLNPDGSVDPTLNTAIGFNKMAYALALQADGKILVGGDFTTYNGLAMARVARLNPDGTPDANFVPGTGASATVRAISLQTDGKIVIGGVFTKVNGITRIRLARLNTNGSLDSSFDVLGGTNLPVLATAIQADGKIIAAGDFVSFNALPVVRLVRVNPDGTRDTTFDPGSGANALIQTLALQANGHLLVGGSFTQIHTLGRNRVARVYAQPVTPPAITTNAIAAVNYCPGGPVSIPFTVTGSFDAGNIFSALLSDENGTFANPISLGGLAGTAAGTISGTMPMGIPAGTGYRIKVVGSTPGITGSTNTTNISVLPSPAVAVSSSMATICQGASATLSATGAINYSWSSGQTSPSLTVTPAATTVYTVTGTSGLGCSAQATVQVTVETPPVLALTATQQVICSGQSAVLSVSGAATYSWVAGPGLVSAADSAIVSPAVPGTYTYTVFGSNSTCAPGQATAQIQVVSGQPATFTYPATTFCQSAPAPTPVTSTTGIFSASPAGLVFSNAATGAIDPAASAPGVYSLIFTPNTPCASPSVPANITITVGPTATVAPVTIACQGTSLVLQAGGPGAATYSWSGPNNFSASGQTITIPNSAPAMSGTYTLTSGLGGCTQVLTTTVAVTAAPAGGFTVVQGTCAGCFNLFNNIPAPNTYVYNFGDGSPVSTHPNPVHQYQAAGTYTITQTVTNAAGCSTVTTQVVSVVLAAADELEANSRIYPNPTAGKLTIELPESLNNQEISADLYSLTGQVVQTFTLLAGQPNEVNLGLIPAGAYLLRITTSDGIISKQVMLQR